jgi:hypothetical protein
MKQFCRILSFFVLALTLMTVAPAGTAQADIFHSKTKKPINKFVTPDTLVTGLKIKPGSPILEMGDWNSSGAPELPYDPSYPYSYRCQLQLQDSIKRVEKTPTGDRYYDLIAVAETIIDNTHTGAQGKDLQWYGKKVFSMQEIVDSADAIPFDTSTSYIGIGFRPDTSAKGDVTNLYVSLSQQIGQLVFADHSVEKSNRSASRIVSTVYLDIRSQSPPAVPALSIRVICDKEK